MTPPHMHKPSAELLSLRCVAYTYRALPVLKNINWRWLRDQQWACIGPNGSGKTTLAKILSGQLAAETGELDLHAMDTSDIAYVCFEQQKALCDRDKQRDDSEFRADAQDPGTRVRDAILGSAAADAEFQQWTQRLGIQHILDRGIRFISTGEMRKTLLLRAILSRPTLLILDNPLDGLDSASQAHMREVLQSLLHSELRVLLLCRALQDVPPGISHAMVLDEGVAIIAAPLAQVLESAAVAQLLHPPPLVPGPLPAPASRPYTLDRTQALLRLRDVNVSYGDTRVLHKVNWTFESGQHCCIAGPNGCGKTTLLSLVNGDNHKAYGQDITLFGIRRGSGESVWDIKQKFGLLDTQLHLNHVRGMRVLEVVVSGFFDTIGLYDDWGDQQRATAEQWLTALGLDACAKSPFDDLSFGLQRMVLLARAMVKSPAILILDEPCLGLDGHHRQLILSAIDHIAQRSDTQILYVSHSLGEMPRCINQRLQFEARDEGFELVVSTSI